MQKTAFELNKINITPNQEKVIKDKYLRAGQPVEKWLYGVAYNIALAEILNSPKAAAWGAFEGVHYKELPADGRISRTLLYHKPYDFEVTGRSVMFAADKTSYIKEGSLNPGIQQ